MDCGSSTEVLARVDYFGVPRAIIEDYLKGSYYLPAEGRKGRYLKIE